MAEIYGRPYRLADNGAELTPCAPHEVLSRIGDRWTIIVLSLLSIDPSKPMRFSDIRRGVNGVSQRMLTVTLRHLERDGLVLRHYYPEVPPRVEYALTPMGKSLLPALEGFTAWIREHWPAIETARASFDATAQRDTPTHADGNDR